jgi:hypothetical protein
MQKLLKRRMGSYLHPIGMAVRAYELEGPQRVSAPADGTSYTNPTPQQRMIPNDPTHNEALRTIATAAIAAAVPAAALGPGSAVRAAGAAIGVTVTNTCVTCHTTKKN